MNKPFLLIAGFVHYPIRGTGDWVGCFASREEAKQMVERIDWDCFKINNELIDWYEIIDLREWTK